MSALYKGFCEGTLDAGDFGHADHIRVAWEALSRHEFFEAASEVAAGLRRLTEQAGVPEKYNATVTLAFLSQIAERMAGAPHEDADTFLAANPDLLGPGALAMFSKDRLGSALAHGVALLPDQVGAPA